MNHDPVMTPTTAFAPATAGPSVERDRSFEQNGSFSRSKATASITPPAIAFAIPSDCLEKSWVKKNGSPPSPEASAIGIACNATVTHVTVPLGRGNGCGTKQSRSATITHWSSCRAAKQSEEAGSYGQIDEDHSQSRQGQRGTSGYAEAAAGRPCASASLHAWTAGWLGRCATEQR